MKIFKTEQEAIDYSNNNPTETVESTEYYSDGQLCMHCFFVNGKKHGECEIYDDKGNIDKHYFYVNGALHGECKSYHDNGQLDVHCFFVNGKMHGELKARNSNGQLILHSFFVDGKKYNVDHLNDGSYKSKCILSTLFNGNLCAN